MTEREIITALERTASWVCDECKFHGEMCDGDKCEKVVAENALDLIKRLKAENERLQKNIDGLNIFTKNHTKVIRLQAIKEFAKELKNCFAISGDYLDIINIIDNLVKEMTEIETNQRKEDEGK
ncbi:MAG: hypothetical protein KIG53_06960 [Oscillospiraceae bacterium]|nr:hypothetical protein [Oscillospiraceae bacterium]